MSFAPLLLCQSSSRPFSCGRGLVDDARFIPAVGRTKARSRLTEHYAFACLRNFQMFSIGQRLAHSVSMALR